MSKNVIFYFTGTGNSLKAAKDIASKLGDCDMFLMPAYKEKSIAAGYERVGFVFPVYAGGPPLCVQRFMKEIDFILKITITWIGIITLRMPASVVEFAVMYARLKISL